MQNIPKTDRVKILLNKQIKLNIELQTSSEEELIEIIKAFGTEFDKAGSCIFQQKGEVDRFFIIEEGVLDVLQDGDHVEVLKAPASFGEIELFFGSLYNVAVRARSNCTLWSLRQEDYSAITSQFKLKRTQFKNSFLRNVTPI